MIKLLLIGIIFTLTQSAFAGDHPRLKKTSLLSPGERVTALDKLRKAASSKKNRLVGSELSGFGLLQRGPDQRPPQDKSLNQKIVDADRQIQQLADVEKKIASRPAERSLPTLPVARMKTSASSYP